MQTFVHRHLTSQQTKQKEYHYLYFFELEPLKSFVIIIILFLPYPSRPYVVSASQPASQAAIQPTDFINFAQQAIFNEINEYLQDILGP